MPFCKIIKLVSQGIEDDYGSMAYFVDNCTDWETVTQEELEMLEAWAKTHYTGGSEKYVIMSEVGVQPTVASYIEKLNKDKKDEEERLRLAEKKRLENEKRAVEKKRKLELKALAELKRKYEQSNGV